MNRRTFLEAVGTLVSLGDIRAAQQELSCDIAVIGGGVGGVAAALAALRAGLRVVVTEETDWLGGQLTSQAVPPASIPG